MRAYGSVATGGAGQRGIQVPTAPRSTGRDVVADRERAHTPPYRIPTVQQPAPAPEPADDGPIELPDYILDFAVLMRDTEGHDDPQVKDARKKTANAAMALHRVWTGLQRAQRTPHPATIPPAPVAQPAARPRGSRLDPAVVDAFVRLYVHEQLSIPQIAARLNTTPATVRRHLVYREVQLRDDRATRSGGANKRTTDVEFIRQAAELYAVGGHTIDKVARLLSTGTRQVRLALDAAGVQVRPAVARTPRDHAAGVRRRMDAAGVTSAEVRAWARATGRDVSDVGQPPAAVITAYLDAHHSPSSAAGGAA